MYMRCWLYGVWWSGGPGMRGGREPEGQVTNGLRMGRMGRMVAEG